MNALLPSCEVRRCGVTPLSPKRICLRNLCDVRYLSKEWIAAADAAVRNAAATAPAERVVIDQVIEDAVSYRVTISHDDASIQPLVAEVVDTEANARFTQSLATATAVAQGTTDAHQAFLLGHIRFEGDVDLLITRRPAFAWLESVLAPVLAKTIFE